MKDNHQTTYFWKYYKHYENYSKDQIKKYKNIYRETKKIFLNKPIDTFE